MNLENLLESSLINEMGGNVFDYTSRIPKENVQPTIREYKKQVLDKLGIERFQSLGSTGKKSSSGDIDLGVSTTMDVKEIGQKLNDIGIPNRPAGTQVWTAFPQYGPDGKELDSTVQIDIMLGDLDWMTHAYYSPGEGESKYKGAHRNLILGLALRYAKEEDAPEGGKVGLAYSAQGGVNKKRRFKKVMTRGKNKGQEKEDSEFIERNFIKNWDGLLKYLSDNTKETWTIEDVDQPFEGLLEKVRRSFDAETFEKIKAGVIEGCKKKGIDIPDELEEEIQLGFFNMLAEQVLNEVNAKGKIKKKIKDYFRIMGYEIKDPGDRLKPDLRIVISGHPDNTENLLKKTLKDLGYSDYEIEVIAPNKSVNSASKVNYEAKSGKYYTFKISVENENIYLVDASEKDSRINRKQLTPNNIVNTSKKYKTGELYKEVSNYLDKSKMDEDVKSYLKYLMDLIKEFDEFSDEVPSSAQYKIQKNDKEFNITENEKPKIFNDFGEVLCAYFLGRLTGDRIKFPKDANNPIADFSILDKNNEFGTPVSVKNESGAKASLKKLITNENFKEALEDDIGYKHYEPIKIIEDSKDVLHSFLRLAKYYDTKSIKEIEKRIGNINLNDSSDKIKNQMYKWLDSRFVVDGTEEQRQKLFDDIRDYARAVGYGEKMDLEFGYNPTSKKRFGVFIYPLYVEITKKLENDKEMRDKIERTVNKLEAKQINIYNRSNSIEFKITNFGDIGFKFEQGNISTWNPLNSNITFKLYQK